jgi:endonuclease-8
MPEGDTVHKLAAYLAPELGGRSLVAGVAQAAATVDLAGRQVEAVFAQGKHLFIEFDDAWLLRIHLGMWGSWHGYAVDEAWRKPRRQASVVLGTGERVFVCFNARQVELLRHQGVRRRTLAMALGPDLLAPALDEARIVQRARSLVAAATPILDVLLDQRIASGIGNVYKSEVLYLEGLHPMVRLGELNDDRLIDAYRRARGLLQRNTGGGPRVTRWANDAAGRLWVYGRGRQPCLRCAQSIRVARLGKDVRSTYWCPTCQAEDAKRGLT